MSRDGPPRLSKKDFVLIWLSAFLAVMLSKLLDLFLSWFGTCDRAPPAWVPQGYCSYWAAGMTLFIFSVYSVLLVAVVLAVLRKLGFIR